MTKFANKTFSSPANNQAYRDNWDSVFNAVKCDGMYDDGIADGNLTACSKREGCGRSGCPAEVK